MKATGIVRRIDDLGRVVLPVDLRRALGLEIRDPVEVFVDEDAIILRKYQLSCVFCGSSKDTTLFRSKPICPECRRQLKSE